MAINKTIPEYVGNGLGVGWRLLVYTTILFCCQTCIRFLVAALFWNSKTAVNERFQNSASFYKVPGAFSDGIRWLHILSLELFQFQLFDIHILQRANLEKIVLVSQGITHAAAS
jgi:hypothetical protein